ncbi:MAG TPA: [protein-PII] uridylyltransferase [Terriglobales bacterium]|nr:[protein-PII] uridylyltransferase [Terriglobales bacterium]
MAAAGSLGSLREQYLAEMAQIRSEFDKNGDGIAAAHGRSELVDRNVIACGEPVSSGKDPVALVALGGYGRQMLFPHSDVDLMFLCQSEAAKQAHRDGIRTASQGLWDLRLKLSPTTRTISECDRIDPENVEFTIALMDARFISGNEELFLRLKRQLIPALLKREMQTLVRLLVERTRIRHEKYGRTIFHLEPNLKEVPGGIRDYNVACWLRQLAEVGAGSEDLGEAIRFLSAARTFLHYCAGRDDNTLSWEAQDKAAAKGIGMPSQETTSATSWMRVYFRNARAIERVTLNLLHDVPTQKSTIYRQFQRWRSRVSNADFSVVDGRVYFQNPSSAGDAAMVLRAFEFVAQHGFQLSSDAEARIARVMPNLVAGLPWREQVGSSLVSILKSPYAAHSLRSMHALGLLGQIIPEFQLVDALVVRDFYHRYTVDEHTFTAIDNLHRLPQRENEWEKRFLELLNQLERPEVLYLAMLLHDLGKGMATPNHMSASVELARPAMGRLGIAEEIQEEVLYLIGAHLEMSAAMRRDIFDPENVRAFVGKVGTAERLRQLCLLTYADIRAVNPDALTPWKAENLWRLYVAASNQLNRGVDDDLFHAEAGNEQLRRLEKLIPNRTRQLQGFLEGLPRRYLLSHTTDQIAVHFNLSLGMVREPIAVALKMSPDLYELSVVSSDRPFLFARIAGALAAWGMNIVKANAFSNAAGVAVDSFYFKDRFRTLELNPTERERFKRSVTDVVSGKSELQQLLDRRSSDATAQTKVLVQPKVMLDNEASSHSSVLEVNAQDKPGLLYRIASSISEEGCNIELALIDTEGQAAIDVFYITRNHKKLSVLTSKSLKKSLLAELS